MVDYERAAKNAAVAGLFGGFFSAVQVGWRDSAAAYTRLPRVQAIARVSQTVGAQGAFFAAAAGVYTVVEGASAGTWGRESRPTIADAAAGGFASGALFGLRTGKFSHSVGSACALAVVMGAVHYFEGKLGTSKEKLGRSVPSPN